MTEPAHYNHGPSGAHRWMNCPGSIQAEEGYPDTAGDAADEGTAAHWLLEQCLLAGQDVTEWLDAGHSGSYGNTIPAGEETGCVKDWPITGEMIEAVQMAIDYVKPDLAKKGTKLWVEERVRLDETLGLPAKVGGTCDIMIYLPRSKMLKVIDFKYGKGHVVEIVEYEKGQKPVQHINEQAALYALGGLYRFDAEYKGKREIQWVEMTIIQPRAYHKKGPIRSYKTTPVELMATEMKLIEVVPITLQKDPPLVAGEKQCHFCKAKKDCFAHAAWRSEEATAGFTAEEPEEIAAGHAGDDFEVEVEQQVIESDRAGVPDLQLPQLPPASSLTLKQLGQVQPMLSYLEDWIKAAKEETRTRLLHDLKVPGKRLAQGPGSRPWADEKAVRDWVSQMALLDESINPDDFYEPAKLKSVAKVEKALGKAKFKKLLGDKVSYVAGGPIVVDEDSDRPEYVKAGEDFEAEEKPEESESHPLL